VAVVNGNQVTFVEKVGRTTTGDPDEIGHPLARTVIDKAGTMAKGRRGSKIVNSFVRHGHDSRHPGFAQNTFPARGSKLGHIRSARGAKRVRRSKRY